MMKTAVVGALVGALIAVAGCTSRNPDYCEADQECDDPAKPFCDVSGEFAESGHTPHICTARPEGCSIERCGCDVGQGLSCDLDQLTVCNADGHSTSVETCALGCSTEPRCLTFEPSNGLGPALEMAASAPDVVLPPGVRIDTALGTVLDAAGQTLSVPSLVVAQPAGPAIRVFIGASFVIDDAHIEGAYGFAVAAKGQITIKGILDAAAKAEHDGPGAALSPAACVGTASVIGNCATPPLMIPCGPGAGGAGNATLGGVGGSSHTAVGAPAGGAAIPGFVPLGGGCRGGENLASDGASVAHPAGGGGGGIELVSADRIIITSSGFVDVAGGGGQMGAGGGSGGNVILEAPSVRIEGDTSGVTANGGAGGACDASGADGGRSLAPAAAPQCTTSGGNGGTASSPPQPGQVSCPSGSCTIVGIHGGGGGAVGRLSVSTRPGGFDVPGLPTLSVAITNHTLVTQ